MALAIRSNPVPLSGALFVRANPKRRTSRRRARRTNPGFAKALAALRRLRKRNGLAMRANGLAMRANRRYAKRGARGRFVRNRRNGLAMRANGLAMRTNRKRHNVRKNRYQPRAISGRFVSAKNVRGMKRTGGKRGAWRKAMRVNYKRYRRGGTGIRHNPIPFVGGLFKTVTKYVGKVPVVGPRVAPFLLPAAIGAVALVPLHYGLKYGGKYVPEVVKPFGYTLGALLLAVGSAFLPIGSKATKGAIAGAMVTVGAAVDVFRKFGGTSSTLGEYDDLDGYGDGMAYEIKGMGAYGTYGDASMMDAAYCGEDFDALEGDAAIKGPMTWARRFGQSPTIASRAVSTTEPEARPSRHAGRPGHRWGWMIRLLGPENFRKVAAMNPEARVALIKRLREQAIATAQAALAESTSAPAIAASESPVAAENLGALLYAGASY